MSSSYTWKVKRIECLVNAPGDQKNYVLAADWSCLTTIDGVTDGIHGCVVFPVEEKTSYVPFEQLTEETVLNWIFESEGFDKQGVESRVEDHMQVILNPIITVPPLPWENN